MTTDREELRALVEVLRTVSRHSPNVRYSSSTIPAALDRASRYLNRPAFGEPAPSPADPQYVVEAGWLALDVGRHTCAGGTPESGYAHEPSCGLEPLERVEVLAPLLVPEAEERGREEVRAALRDLIAQREALRDERTAAALRYVEAHNLPPAASEMRWAATLDEQASTLRVLLGQVTPA